VASTSSALAPLSGRGTMRAMELAAYGDPRENLRLVEKPIPRPGKGEVLVRMHAAPVNPSDLSSLNGSYGGGPAKLPAVPGLEGSGTVVAAGAGLLPRFLRGQRVACSPQAGTDGTWAEYMVTVAGRCIPLLKSTTLEQGATLIVNPMTAWALMDIARRGKHRAVVMTAAASVLGGMIRKLANMFGIEVVNIVRRPEQAALLQSQGATHVLDSDSPTFDEELRALCRQLNITLAFDAVAGDMTGRVLSALQSGGRIIVFSYLSLQSCVVDGATLIFGNKSIENFWLSTWVDGQNTPSLLLASRRVQRLLSNEMESATPVRVSLQDAPAAIAAYEQHMTGSKVMLVIERQGDPGPTASHQ
jgi:NADPH2:quinone reductase